MDADMLDELTEAQWAVADRVEAVLEAADRSGMTISMVARKVRCDYLDARAVLAYLDRHQYAHTTGNGAWSRYHAGRA